MSPAPRALAVADDPLAQEAAEDLLLAGGSALGAVAAAFFAAAGAYAGVLLSPVTVLVAGVGLGARAFDGRPRQPGLGTKRPRGFKEGEAVPDAAGVAVPASVAAVLVALAYDDALRLARLTKTGIRRARDSGAEGRALLLERIRSVGARALQEPAFVRPLLHVAGPAQGGLLTSSDFVKLTDLDRPALEQPTENGKRCLVPWALENIDIEPPGRGHAVCAVDARGLLAVLTYRRVVDGLVIDDLELEAPVLAVPVRRGVPRVAPGTPLPAPAPVAILLNENGVPIQARAWPSSLQPQLDSEGSAPSVGLKWDPVTQRAEALR